MKGTIHTKTIALTALVTALAIPAIAGAKATDHGYRFVTDTLGGTGTAPSAQGHRIITDTLGGNGVAPAAQGIRIVTDTLGGNGVAPEAQGIRIVTDTLGGNGGSTSLPDAFERYTASHPFGRDVQQAAQPQGFRFITDTLGGNGGPGALVAPSYGGFSWSDAGIGAGIAVGTLALLAASLMLLRQLRHRQLQTA